MKLDYDLVRDIMLTIEGMSAKEILNNTTYKNHHLLKHRSKDEVDYHILRMIEAGYIPESSIQKYDRQKMLLIKVTGLTWQGHQFLNHVRNQSVVDKALEAFPNLKELPVNIMLSVLEKFL